MPIHQLTKEKLDELKDKIAATKEQFKTVKETTIQAMWTSDLTEFKKILK